MDWWPSRRMRTTMVFHFTECGMCVNGRPSQSQRHWLTADWFHCLLVSCVILLNPLSLIASKWHHTKVKCILATNTASFKYQWLCLSYHSWEFPALMPTCQKKTKSSIFDFECWKLCQVTYWHDENVNQFLHPGASKEGKKTPFFHAWNSASLRSFRAGIQQAASRLLSMASTLRFSRCHPNKYQPSHQCYKFCFEEVIKAG